VDGVIASHPLAVDKNVDVLQPFQLSSEQLSEGFVAIIVDVIDCDLLDGTSLRQNKPVQKWYHVFEGIEAERVVLVWKEGSLLMQLSASSKSREGQPVIKPGPSAILVSGRRRPDSYPRQSSLADGLMLQSINYLGQVFVTERRAADGVRNRASAAVRLYMYCHASKQEVPDSIAHLWWQA